MAFNTNIRKKGLYSSIILEETQTGTFAEIFSFGALLNSFSCIHQGASVNVIEGFENLEDAVIHLTPYFKSAKLSPFVCRVNKGKYSFGGVSHQLFKYESNGNAIHGLLYDSNFTIKEYFSDDTGAAVILEYLYDLDNEGFPFAYTCEVEYFLRTNNTLSVTTTVTNKSTGLMPVTDGWHPYFTLGDTIDQYLVEFQSKEMLEFDDQLIPTGKMIPYEEFGSLTVFGNTKLDNCFSLNFAECQPLCVIRNPAKKIQVEIYPEKSYPYLQLYTPDSRKSIAIENLSAAPDAFNNGIGIKTLSPGEKATFATSFTIKSL